MAGNSPRDQLEIEEEEDRKSSEKCRRAGVSACGENSFWGVIFTSEEFRYCTNRVDILTETRCEDIRCNAV